MSEVHAASSFNSPRCKAPADLTAMQDQLYEIVAVGIDPSPETTLDQVESFLHEHARKPKSLEEFAEFFKRHSLEVAPSTPADGEAGEFAMAACPEPERAAPLPVAPDEATRDDPTPARPIRVEIDDDLRLPEASSSRGLALLWGALAVVLCVLGGLSILGYETITSLRGELARARSLSSHNEAVITELRGQAAGIEAKVSANGELMKRLDDKSDKLLQSIERVDEHPRRRRQRPSR